MEAYNLTTEDDILAKLLALNLELAEREKQGETIIGAKNFRHFSQSLDRSGLNPLH
jgi:hypothetical protein